MAITVRSSGPPPVARVSIARSYKMNAAQRKRVAAWLRKCATSIEKPEYADCKTFRLHWRC